MADLGVEFLDVRFFLGGLPLVEDIRGFFQEELLPLRDLVVDVRSLSEFIVPALQVMAYRYVLLGYVPPRSYLASCIHSLECVDHFLVEQSSCCGDRQKNCIPVNQDILFITALFI